MTITRWRNEDGVSTQHSYDANGNLKGLQSLLLVGSCGFRRSRPTIPVDAGQDVKVCGCAAIALLQKAE